MKTTRLLVIQNTSSLADVTQEGFQSNELLGVLFRFLLRMERFNQANDIHRDDLDDRREHTILQRQERLHLRIEQLGKLTIFRPQLGVTT